MLRAALPSISANVLTQRIRALEAAGLARRSYLPPPAASHVYGLGPLAEALRPALNGLADWRAQHQQTHRANKAGVPPIAPQNVVTGDNQTGGSE